MVTFALEKSGGIHLRLTSEEGYAQEGQRQEINQRLFAPHALTPRGRDYLAFQNPGFQLRD